MQIHVVAAGETISSIASQYGTTTENIVAVNELPNPDNLVVGQSIAIRIPEVTYTVAEGDTLSSIAQNNNITVAKLLQNNPLIAVANTVKPGDNLVITYRGDEVIDTISIMGMRIPLLTKKC